VRIAIGIALTLALGLTACGSSGSGTGTQAGAGARPGQGKPVVTLGTKTSSEQLLLGQLYEQALEARGFVVALKQNIGSTAIADTALRSGQIDLYPEPVERYDHAVAHDRTAYPDVASALSAGRAYARSQDVTLLAPTPFADAEAVAVTAPFAAAHRLRSVADLAALDGLRLGAAPELLRQRVGVPGLERVYGIHGIDFAPLTIGLQYTALDAGKIDAAVVAASDGQLKSGRYVVLGDPRHLFGVQNIVPVVASRVLAAEGPAFADTLDAVSATLTTRAVQQLGAAVTLDGRSPAEAARDFLRTHRLA
jgi:osmoprotectant transport system substrate-binding protein